VEAPSMFTLIKGLLITPPMKRGDLFSQELAHANFSSFLPVISFAFILKLRQTLPIRYLNTSLLNFTFVKY
jgi:hypothetical protein